MKILYAGAIGQKDTATSVHVLRNARLLEKMGNTVFFCCEYPICGETLKDEQIKVDYSAPYQGSKKIRSFQWMVEQVLGFRLWRRLKKSVLEIQPDILILYDPASIMFYERTLRFCKRLKIGFCIEVTEWADSKDFAGFDKFICWQRDMRKKYLDGKCGNIIPISPLLEEHYVAQGARILRLPPIYQDEDFVKEPLSVKKEPLKLVFAGTLAKKDFLLPMIMAVNKINVPSIKIEFTIIGVDEKELRNNNDIEIGKGIIFLGRMQHSMVLQYVKKSHYSVLLRENKRYAKAGVSTKFTEAMCVGTPSICTKVGGTDVYVKDGVNGILVENNEVGTLVGALNQILNMPPNQIMNMKKEALKTAKEYFYDKKYRKGFSKFLDEAKASAQQKKL